MKDKLFLLSLEELEQYLPNQADRVRKIKEDSVCWWLRSPGYLSYHATFVYYDGAVGQDGIVGGDKGAVCPALCLKPESLSKLPRSKKGYAIFGRRKWQVLDEETGLLLSKRAICRRKFDNQSNDYESSKIRKFLNEELLSELFNENEIDMIQNVEIHGDKVMIEREDSNAV